MRTAVPDLVFAVAEPVESSSNAAGTSTSSATAGAGSMAVGDAGEDAAKVEAGAGSMIAILSQGRLRLKT